MLDRRRRDIRRHRCADMVSFFLFSKILLLADVKSRLPPDQIGMVVDKGIDFPEDIEESLLGYGKEMWLFRERSDRGITTRALNRYRGDIRG